MKNINVMNDVISYTSKAVRCLKSQDIYYGQLAWRLATSCMAQLDDAILSVLSPYLLEAADIQAASDNLLLADVLDSNFLPALKNCLQKYVTDNSDRLCVSHLEDNLLLLEKKCALLVKKITDGAHFALSSDCFHVELTNNGMFTFSMQNNGRTVFFHSNTDPVDEGRMFASYYQSDDDCFDFTVLGFGFGYHINALLDADKRNHVTVLETNPYILSLAFVYRDLSSLLSSERVTIKLINETDIPDYIKGHFILHYPSLLMINNDEIRERLHDYFMHYGSMISNRKLLDANYHINKMRNDPPADVLFDVFAGKSCIYVGGGPSLEYHIDFLKDCFLEKSHIILCASTAYKKLLNAGITPDFIMIIDPKERMRFHFTGANDDFSSLLYLSTASTEAIDLYKNKRYIMYQNGYKKSSDFAKANNLSVFETAGSVSCTAIDFLIKSGCKNITTIALDLANTDGKRHAYDKENSDKGSHTFNVKGVSGGLVVTTGLLNGYRLWIENRIKNSDNINFVNMSHGAFIHGMKNIF